MDLVAFLLTWDKLRLAKALAQQARENAALRDRVGELELKIFWLEVAERKKDGTH